jgi:hypothetical protein
MGTQTEKDVFGTIDSLADKDIPEKFISKLIPIFEHSKEEIIEFLKSKSEEVLKRIRDLAFAELLVKLPEYAGRELYARRKLELLAEDIYVFAYSAVSALPDKRLSKCLKAVLDLDATNIYVIEDEAQDTANIHTVIELCVKLQDKVNKLEEVVKTQSHRIGVLEQQQTSNKLQVLKKLLQGVLRIRPKVGSLCR